MNNVLFISFDLIRTGEPEISLSAASLIAYLKHANTYGYVFNLNHQTINCYDVKQEAEAFEIVFKTVSLSTVDVIALSAHIWSEKYVQYFVKRLRKQHWNGVIVLGGPQINDSFNNLKCRYSDVNVFIQNYGERSFLSVCEDVNKYRNNINILSKSTPEDSVKPVYTSGIINLKEGQAMVRLETKRNCPYNCSFCHFTDYSSNKVRCLDDKMIQEEIDFLQRKRVQKINIMDPTFNIMNHKRIIDYIKSIGYKALFSFQAHFNALRINFEEKLDVFTKINSHLEFGLQCTNLKTLAEVNRSHNLESIKKIIAYMVKNNMSFEISLIYGLPFQTINHFKDSVKFLTDLGVKNIYGFPLQLYRGTQLYNNKEKYGITTKPNDLNIPQVTSTNWMKKDEILYLNNWIKLKSK